MATQSKGYYRAYREIKFTRERRELIDTANAVIDEYAAQGLDMTLRQLYYQMVARFPEHCPNNDKFYNKLQSAINDGRMGGLVSWTAIQDRTRNLLGTNFSSSPEEAFAEAIANYKLDLWQGQPIRPMVVVEKEAQIGNIAGICNEYRIDFYASRGYNSQSEMWRAGQRCADMIKRGQRPLILDMRDHDPSGLDMTDDYRDRLELFAGTPIMVTRIALNLDQILELNPPENPAKHTDIRIDKYQQHMIDMGHPELKDVSWEMDSLSPTYIRDLIKGAVERVRNKSVWDDMVEREVNDIKRMRFMAGLETQEEDDE